MILEHVNHPFLVNLAFAFQTPSKLYFIMQFMSTFFSYFRGWITFPTLIKCQKVSIKTSKILYCSNSTSFRTSSFERFHISWFKVGKCAHGWLWKCFINWFWNGQGYSWRLIGQYFLRYSLIFGTWSPCRWRLWQTCWLVVTWYLGLLNDVWIATIL